MENHLHDLMVDSRIEYVDLPAAKMIRKKGLSYLVAGENHDYFTKEAVVLNSSEVDQYIDRSNALYRMMMTTAQFVADQNLWELAGIPKNAVDLVRYSLQYERPLHLLGRFDFAGGVDGSSIAMLEFNADTCSLLPETAHVLVDQTAKLRKKKKFQIFNNLIFQLTQSFQAILRAYPDRIPNLLLSYLGNEEDYLNLEVIAEAARQAGFQEVNIMLLEKVVFSEEEGIFLQLGPESYTKYDFFFKMFPWDFAAYEEPELMDLLSKIVMNKQAIVLNPAFTMLLQSKGLLKFLYDQFPNEKSVLQTSFDPSVFRYGRYVEKPFYGRTGDNVKIHGGLSTPLAQNGGDYGHFPMVYQAFAKLDQDSEKDYYQPSMFWSGEACALCFRRQEDMIVDDDAEYLAHLIER
ncbi:MAG: glutathionylspermidine synthase family protein [Bacteroidota bacterium]